MKYYSSKNLKKIGIRIFEACGATHDEAEIVASELVEASLLGLDSHGVMRYTQYVDQVLEGGIKPGAEIRIIKETPNTALVDCGWNFGMVSANSMVEIAYEKASRNNISCVTSMHSHHVGSLGSYVQKLAQRGMFAFATANSSRHGHFVTPFGGKEGRLATNPLAYAAPTSGLPVVMDMSTSMIAEGKIRVLMQEGKPVPEGCIQDAEGNPTTDPGEFYGPPRGTILPFGGRLGYKGFGLGLLVEIMSTTLAGIPVTPDGEKDEYINGLCLIAINPEAFFGKENFRESMDILCDYIKSTPPAPGYKEVVIPGTLDYKIRETRLSEGIPVAEETWIKICQTAAKVGVMLDDESGNDQI